jgi:membrane complex biogenesis BtpA family protein
LSAPQQLKADVAEGEQVQESGVFVCSVLANQGKTDMLFNSGCKFLIGVIHLAPLPGSPRWGGNLGAVLKKALADAKAYEHGGASALFIENFGDVPFSRSAVGPETVAAMAAAGRAVRAAVKLPIGFNVLRNDARAALALCAACDGSFIRVNVHTGAMLTDQGIIEGNAYETLRYRKTICPKAAIFADVHVKHAVPLGSHAIENSARDTLERGLADALIISGVGTGHAADLADVRRVRQTCPSACILVGSGVSGENVNAFVPFADGFIVGSSLKRGGKVTNAVDAGRVRALARAIG